MTELVAGLSIGLAAGFTPGPLQALVFTATLQRGFAAGWRVAVAPALTDVPIVALAVFAVGALSDAGVRALGIGGGIVVAAFGVWEVARARRVSEGADPVPPTGDLWRGMIVNVLSPHPWLFWIAVGGPLVVDAWEVTPGRAVAFVAGFYGTLVGAKILLAAVVAAGRSRLSASWRYRLTVLGGTLLVFAGAVLIWNWA